MLLGTPKYGIGSFSNREDLQAAIETLQNSDFSMKQITIVMQEVESGDEDIAISKDEFIESKATSGVTKGALTAGTIGGISGVLMGLGALMLPGIGSIAVIGVKSALVGRRPEDFTALQQEPSWVQHWATIFLRIRQSSIVIALLRATIS